MASLSGDHLLSETAETLERAAWEYGKIGLLIDDSPECRTRVARALYGCEALPRWWVVVRSIRCACDALARILELHRSPDYRPLRVFILIDRYLPPYCQGLGAIAWDGADPKHAALLEEMNERITEILQCCSPEIQKGRAGDTTCLIRFATSFPIISARSLRKEPLPWRMRSIELLQDERRRFQASGTWQGLLRFGPENRQRAGPPPASMKPAEIAAALWRSRTWNKSLERLAKMLADRKRVILVTGAGASLAASPTTPGMLTTDEMIRRVCRAIRQEKEIPHNVEQGCACKVEVKQEEPAVFPDEPAGLSPVDLLLWKYEHQKGVPLKFELEKVCSPLQHESSQENFEQFHELFRHELYERDYGCTYQHWLMARFLWTAIVTTNFDGFHERASAAVARILPPNSDERLHVLSLGTVRPFQEEGSGDKAGAAKTSVKGRLFKPYGSLYSLTGELILGEEELARFQENFERSLDKSLGKITDEGESDEVLGAVVVVGQSMRDELVGEALKHLEGPLNRFELLWVDPGAHARSDRVEGPDSKKTVWETWIKARMDQGRTAASSSGPIGSHGHVHDTKCSGPFPATALEFIYDLWSEYRGAD